MLRFGAGLAVGACLLLVSCGDDAGAVSTGEGDGPDRNNERRDAGPQPMDASMMSRDSGPRTPPDSGGQSSPDDDSGAGAATCGSVNCGPNGDCVEDAMGVPTCVCDNGYVVDENAQDGLCVEDRTCIQVRILECRTEFGSSGSAVGMPLSVSYCSGNPVTRLRVEDLTLEEDGGEGFEPIVPSSESSFSIVDRTFTSHIYLVVDISGSIKDSDVLDDVAAGIDTFLDGLTTLDDRFQVAVYVFDGKPYLYPLVQETTDLDYVRQQLSQLPTAPGLDSGSTNLYGAVIAGLNELERSKDFKRLQSHGGVLSTGTLIVVSDGDDEAGFKTFTQARAAIDDTVTNVITVGLGDAANYPRLTELGRDGSFSAPTASLIDQAFNDLSLRFQQYARSLYFFGYCSPKRGGSATARVGIRDLDIARPSCAFSAANFTSGCSAELFDPVAGCANRECAGIIGCGTCSEDSCCAWDETTATVRCVAPSQLDEGNSCGVEAQCASSLTCAGTPLGCRATAGVTAECGPTLYCDPEDGYCDAGGDPVQCAPARSLQDTCTAPRECQSGNCSRVVDNPLDSNKYCHPTARMFEPCADGIRCEPGTYCNGTTCRPQGVNGNSCQNSAQCAGGFCRTLMQNVRVCDWARVDADDPDSTLPVAPFCYFPLPPDLRDPSP